MKTLILIIASLMPLACFAQEDTVRHLDNLEREAVLKNDTIALYNKYWAPDMVVNTPANNIGTAEITRMLVRIGKLDYASFERRVEKVICKDDIVILMGEETVKPQHESDNAGKTVTRRFTNIWLKKNNEWRMIARQATIISVQ